MRKIGCCPVVGGCCNKGELELQVKQDIFFLAEPFEPKEREKRELAVSNALKDALGANYSPNTLRVGDREPREPAIFCDICRMIQSSAYGIVDISGLNPNVLIEFGMMLSLGKPVFILCKKKEEEDLKQKLPSDIIWKRAVAYEEFIAIQPELAKLIKNRPPVEPELSPAEETERIVAQIAPSLVEPLSKKIEELKKSRETDLRRLEQLLEEAKLDQPIAREKEEVIPTNLQKRIEVLLQKIEPIEKFSGLPENPRTAFLRGNFYHNKGEYELALEQYDWVLTLEPERYEAWANKGFALVNLNRPEEAIKCCDRAIELKPDYYEAWLNKGLALVKLERYEEAIKCCDRAIELKPERYEAWNNKGSALVKLERPEKAIKCCDRAIELKPDSYEAWLNKGLALVKLERPEKAIKCCDRATELKPDSYEAWLSKGIALVQFNRYEEAIKCYDKAMEIKPDDVSATQNLAEAYLIIGIYQKALHSAQKALQISSVVKHKCISYFLLFFALLLQGKGNKAEQTLDELLEYLKGTEKGYGVTWDFSDTAPALERLATPAKELIHSLIALLQEKIDIDEFSRRRRALAEGKNISS